MNNIVKFLKEKSGTIILILVLIFCLFFYYYGLIQYRYLVPTGDDPVRHITSAQNLQATGFVNQAEGNLDPPLVQILFLTVANFSNFNVYTVALYLMPLVSILATFSIYFFVKRFFKDQKIALLALFLFVFLSPQPTQILDDGTYMNIFGALIFLPLFILFLTRYLKKSLEREAVLFDRNFIFTWLFGLGVLSYHSLSSVYLLIISGTVFLLLLILKLLAKIRIIPNKVYLKNPLVLFTSILVFGSVVAYDFYLKRTLIFIFNKFGLFKSSDLILGGIMSDQASSVTSFGAFEWFFSYPVLLFGFFGMIVLLFNYKEKFYHKLVFLAWPLALFVGSQSESLPLAQRFGRDLVYPVIIFAACFIFYFIQNQKSVFLRKGLVFILILIFVFGARNFISNKISYNPLMRVQKVDEEAYSWIKDNTSTEAVFLATPGVCDGDWGCNANIVTKRKFLDGGRCAEGHTLADMCCDYIFEIDSESAKNFLKENNVEYVYSGKNILGAHYADNRIDWRFKQILKKSSILLKKMSFHDENLGDVEIYAVLRDKL